MEVQGPVLLQRVSRLSNSCEMSNPFCIDLCSDTESVEVSHNLTTENEQVQSDSDEFQPKQCRDKNTNSSGASSSCEEDSDFEINHPKSKIKSSSDRNRQIKVKDRIIRGTTIVPVKSEPYETIEVLFDEESSNSSKVPKKGDTFPSLQAAETFLDKYSARAPLYFKFFYRNRTAF